MTGGPLQHIPVLTSQLIGVLDSKPEEIGVDCTLGGGGHALAILQACPLLQRLIGIDADPAALERASEKLKDHAAKVTLVRGRFGELPDILDRSGVGPVSFIYADIGTSAFQLDRPERGFSFAQDGPLDMRMDPEQPTRAADLVNGLKEQELADLIYRYGEEGRSRKIAAMICQARRNQRLDSTVQLAEIVCRALGLDPKGISAGRIHPATKTFQALRIAVNDELGQLEQLLSSAPDRLAAGGRFAVISFHSLEDSLVKEAFRQREQDGRYRVLTKKPLTAEPGEVLRNPRSRSAKLRAIEKVSSSEVRGSI